METARHSGPAGLRRWILASAPLLFCCPAQPAGATGPGIILTAVETVKPAPGEFATCTCRVECPREAVRDPRDLLVQFTAPRGWKALSSERAIHLEPGEERTVPFTVWVPPQASSDSLHTAVFSLRASPGAEVLVAAEQGIRVRARFGVSLSASADELEARVGQEASFTVAVRNSGNRTDTVRLETESIPSWPVVPQSTEIVIPAGATRFVAMMIQVPPNAPAATLHLLGVSAVSGGAEKAGLSAGARIEVRTTAMGRRDQANRYARLPVEAALSAGDVAPGWRRLGLRLRSTGQVGPSTGVQVEADLASGPRADGGDGWRNQLFLARVTRGGWGAAAGDVSGEFSDLATATISGRGLSLAAQKETWSVRAIGVRNRGVGRTASWGVGTTRTVAGGPQVGGDLVYREDNAGPFGVRSDRLLCFNSAWEAPRGFQLRGEMAFSGTRHAGESRIGRAAQLVVDRTSRPVQLRARLYTGSSGFGGRTRDRDGLLLFGAYIPPSRPLRLWSHLESSRGRAWASGESPLARSTRYRAGARWEQSRWPGLELSLGGLEDRSALGDSVRSSARRDAGLTGSWSRGGFLAAATIRRGTALDRATGRSGATSGAEVSAGGRVLDWRLALRWNRELDWLAETNASQTTTSVAADLAWAAPSERFSAGMAVSTRRIYAGQALGAGRAEFRLQPRGDYRLGAKLRLQVDAAITDRNGSTRVDRWQVSLRYASEELLPVPWSPVRGGIRGVAFLDSDADGEPDTGERRLDGLVLRVDGRHLVTGRDGDFEWPALDPGTYWIDLDRASIPPGLVVPIPLPLEVRVEAGEKMPVYIPLLSCGEASGIVFLDEDHDGLQSDGESGVSDLHVAAWRDGRQAADGITDPRGRYHLRALPAGASELRIDPAWLPAGWGPTRSEPARLMITPERSVDPAPYGIGPRQKPIIITYPGSGSPGRREVVPPPRSGDAVPEPSR